MKIMLVGNSGGHLNELLQLKDDLKDHDLIFVTNKSKMTIELGKIETVQFVDKFIFNDLKVGKGLFSPLINIKQSYKLLTKYNPDLMITTGAGVALGTLMWCKIFKVKTVFLESAARVVTGSTFGQKIGRYADVVLIQWKSLRNIYKKSKYIGVVFNKFEPARLKHEHSNTDKIKIFITVGTYKLQFNRIFKEVDRLLEEKKLNAEIIAQSGESTYQPQNYTTFDYSTQEEIHRYTEDADLVVCQGGCGSIMDSLVRGKRVIAIPRLTEFDEYSDNHQIELVSELEKRGYIEAVYEDISQLEKVIKNIQDARLVDEDTNIFKEKAITHYI